VNTTSPFALRSIFSMGFALPKTTQFPGQPQDAESTDNYLCDHWRDFANGEMLDN
jgi:hypothetical protein